MNRVWLSCNYKNSETICQRTFVATRTATLFRYKDSEFAKIAKFFLVFFSFFLRFFVMLKFTLAYSGSICEYRFCESQKHRSSQISFSPNFSTLVNCYNSTLYKSNFNLWKQRFANLRYRKLKNRRYSQIFTPVFSP